MPQQTIFNRIVVYIIIAFAICQTALYILASISWVNDKDYIKAIGWYQYDVKVAAVKYTYYLGLKGFLVEGDGISEYQRYSSVNSYLADDSYAFGHQCSKTGYDGFILVVCAAAMSFITIFTTNLRLVQNDNYNMKCLCIFMGLISIGLGAPAYIFFYEECTNQFIKSLNLIDTSTVAKMYVGGDCITAAVICAVFGIFLNIIEIFADCCCRGKKELKEEAFDVDASANDEYKA